MRRSRPFARFRCAPPYLDRSAQRTATCREQKMEHAIVEIRTYARRSYGREAAVISTSDAMSQGTGDLSVVGNERSKMVYAQNASRLARRHWTDGSSYHPRDMRNRIPFHHTISDPRSCTINRICSEIVEVVRIWITLLSRVESTKHCSQCHEGTSEKRTPHLSPRPR